MKVSLTKIKNHEDYYITPNGEIYSSKCNKFVKIKGWIQKNGYRCVTLDNKKYNIHRLVALTFIPNPNNYPIINHIDGNKLNNNISNLEWCTYSHNFREAIRLGLIQPHYASSENKLRSKKTGQYDLEGNLIKIWGDSVEAEKELRKQNIKIHSRNIRAVCNGKRKTTGGFIWRHL